MPWHCARVPGLPRYMYVEGKVGIRPVAALHKEGFGEMIHACTPARRGDS